MRQGPKPGISLGAVFSAAAFGVISLISLIHNHVFSAVVSGNGRSAVAALLTLFETAVEIGACLYAFLFIAAAVLYLLSRSEVSSAPPALLSGRPSVGILYLCCDDLDPEALETLAGLDYDGDVHLIVHDDSRAAPARAAVDEVVAHLRRRYGRRIDLLRRPDRTGGKPAALNFVLAETGHRYEFFLLCDNDSLAFDSNIIPKALSYFRDPRVAIVQCRNVAADIAGLPPVNRALSRSIDVFHVFLSMQSRYGWSLFVGHNAFLRTSAVLDCGGFTPGFFADDLDLAVRLNLREYRIAYAPDIRLAEKHPAHFEAFRRRSYKWAFGCMQILKAHTRRVLTSRALSFPEKLSFFCFAGFYVGQTLLLAYLLARFLIGPLVLPHQAPNVAANVLIGVAIAVTVFAPTLAFFAKERRLKESIPSVLMCALVYGTTDFVCARAVKDCLLGRRRAWIPTNAAGQRTDSSGPWLESLFGFALLLLPLIFAPELLYQPCAYLFLGKFLFEPAIAVLYRDDEPRAAGPVLRTASPAAASSSVGAFLLAGLFLFAAPAQARSAVPVSVAGKEIRVAGRPFLVKGIHYGPWRPGTGPNKGYPYPGVAEVDADLSMIESLGANTILVSDPPEYVLDSAGRHGLKVLYAFFVEWWTLGSPEGAVLRQSLLDRVRAEADHPALLGWVVGNEVPSGVLEQRGPAAIETGLANVYHDIKSIDRWHPVLHSNWPIAKSLKLDFFDIAGFNVYPVWPPEVVAMGFGNYLRRVLQPIAASKPLLITEFGANTLEAGEDGQARLLQQCWSELLQAGACGGVVFEFADEWWKNYDNPKMAGIYWDRREAPGDEKTHDADPEEYYGIATAERTPKPAYAAVRAMFRPQPRLASLGGRALPGGLVALLFALAWGCWWWGRRRAPATSIPER